MTRLVALLALPLACLALLPAAAARAQGTDTLWVEDFLTQTARPWTIQTGTWRVQGTEYRGQCSTYRTNFFYEAGVVTPATPGSTPLVNWQTIAKVRGTSFQIGHETPAIIALRQNVTSDRQGYGLEIVFATSGTSQIRIVRYLANYATVTPALATLDTILVNNDSYYMRFSALHTVSGVELKGKVWHAGEYEPADWLLETVAATEVSGGNVGIGAAGTTNYPIVAVDRVVLLGDKTGVEPQTWGRIKNAFR